MSSRNIARAIDMAQHAAHCHRTGQPRLAALYEKNCREAMLLAKREIRSMRIQVNPFRAFLYIAEDINGVAEMVAGAVSEMTAAVSRNIVSQPVKSDFVLVGPSQQ
ncbi:hypothetical protein [Glutamicibacter sp. TV12E]|uniref:hypothetical protein n=1 Tax=Glutamicibacter sp. TV12E TaxID=3446362 RepID=UPI004034C760